MTDQTTSPLCGSCLDGDHPLCAGWVRTGRQIPDPDPYRTVTRMLAEWVPCGCGCDYARKVVPV